MQVETEIVAVTPVDVADRLQGGVMDSVGQSEVLPQYGNFQFLHERGRSLGDFFTVHLLGRTIAKVQLAAVIAPLKNVPMGSQ